MNKIIKSLIIGIIVLLVGLVANDLYKGQKEKKATMAMNEQIIKDQQASVMSALQDQIKELQNKPEVKPVIQTIYKTNTIEKTIIQPSTVISNEPDLAAIIKEWTPRVAFVVCKWGSEMASGSATFAKLNNLGVVAMTNKHVLVENNYIPNACVITNSVGTYNIDWKQNVSTYSNPYWIGGNEDYGYVRIDNTNQSLTNMVSNNIKLCSSNINIGDKVVILGYPGVGASTGITATEGIISGLEQNYYVTSAKIEHGNSGGAAILLKENCYLGIPSASKVGSIESLGRILKSSFIII